MSVIVNKDMYVYKIFTTEDRMIRLHEMLWGKIVNRLEELSLWNKEMPSYVSTDEIKVEALDSMYFYDGVITAEEYCATHFNSNCFVCAYYLNDNHNSESGVECPYCRKCTTVVDEDGMFDCLDGIYGSFYATKDLPKKIEYAKAIRDYFREE